MEVRVRDNNVDQALRILKKKLIREGVFKHVKDKQFHKTKGQVRREDEKQKQKRFVKSARKAWENAGLDPKDAMARAQSGQRPPKIKQRHLKR